jgi:hypothetical protein
VEWLPGWASRTDKASRADTGERSQVTQELGIVAEGRKVVLGMAHLRPLPGTP